MKIIRIPKTPAAAFDRNRPASSLLQAQVAHARGVRATPTLARPETKAIAPAVETEHDAAEYIGRVTRELHPEASSPWRLPRGKRAPKSGVWLGPARVASKARKKKRKPAAKKARALKARGSRRRTRKHARRR